MTQSVREVTCLDNFTIKVDERVRFHTRHGSEGEATVAEILLSDRKGDYVKLKDVTYWRKGDMDVYTLKVGPRAGELYEFVKEVGVTLGQIYRPDEGPRGPN